LGTFFTLQITVVFWRVLWVTMIISRSARTIWPVPSNNPQPALRITTAAARALPWLNDAFDEDVDDVGLAWSHPLTAKELPTRRMTIAGWQVIERERDLMAHLCGER
jgi:hypothetical protein